MGIFIFAGASSAIAEASANLLKTSGQHVIGISKKEHSNVYSDFHTVQNYDFESLPNIDGPVEGIVYFPGTINLKPFHRISKEEFRSDFEVNVEGAIACIQKYLPNLKQSESPSVVLFSSVAANLGMPFHASISISKGAIESLIKSLAAEYAPNIRFNGIAPSLTNTPLSEKFLATEEKREAARQRNPLKKVGEPNEIAEAVEFLLSKATWMTGEILHLDGGLSSTRSI
jgi:NAD(P)-dependent dehydrogenase (short-subunit alcohol dehydrogenase family)